MSDIIEFPWGRVPTEPKKPLAHETISMTAEQRLADILSWRKNLAFRWIDLKVLRPQIKITRPIASRLVTTSHEAVSEVVVARTVIKACKSLGLIDGKWSLSVCPWECIIEFLSKEPESLEIVSTDPISEDVQYFRTLDLQRIISFIQALDLSMIQLESLLTGSTVIDQPMADKLWKFFNISPEMFIRLQFFYEQTDSDEKWRDYWSEIPVSKTA